ncbi:MAG: metallophosphoesterase family protein, partial [Chloroflexi bacterium]|nr:metallophosphoesterase family protein [Chloroflexota bacterium]
MKTLIISDIHSNIHALNAILACEKDSDQIYCVGDLIDYGAHPKEVIDWARGNQIPCVKGNHDQWVVMHYRDSKFLDTVPTDERAWVHHNAGLLNDDDINYLEQLPETITFELDDIAYGMTHRYQDYDEIVSLYDFDQFCWHQFNRNITRLIIGHTHRQAVRYLSDTTLWLNPGSASYRRKGDPDQTAHYIVITDG